MSKASFRMPPRPGNSAELDQWVAGEGAAHAPTLGRGSQRPGGKLARLTIDLRPELHAKFKAACALKGTRMIDEVTRFIEDWTQKNG